MICPRSFEIVIILIFSASTNARQPRGGRGEGAPPVAGGGAGGGNGNGNGGGDDTVRRQSHNIAEKKRRDKINLKINELKQLVPLDETKKSSNKSAILSRTVEFIKRMEAHYQALWDHNQLLVAENRNFKQIRHSLQQAQLLPGSEEEAKQLGMYTNIPPPQVPSGQPKQERNLQDQNRLVAQQFYGAFPPHQNMTLGGYFQIPPTMQSGGQTPPPTSSPSMGVQPPVTFYPPLSSPMLLSSGVPNTFPLHAPVILHAQAPESMMSNMSVMSSAMVPPVQILKRNTPTGIQVPSAIPIPVSLNSTTSPNSGNTTPVQQGQPLSISPSQNSTQTTTAAQMVHSSVLPLSVHAPMLVIPEPPLTSAAIAVEGPTPSEGPTTSSESTSTGLGPTGSALESIPATPLTTPSPGESGSGNGNRSGEGGTSQPVLSFMSNSIITPSAPVPLSLSTASSSSWSAPTIIAVQSIDGITTSVKPHKMDTEGGETKST